MHSKESFANARTVAVVARLFEQLGKAGAVKGRVGNTVVIFADKAAGIIGDNWEALLESRLHADGLCVSYSIFAGTERYGDIVLLELGVLTGQLPHIDIPGAEQLRRVVAELPLLKEVAACA